MPKPTDFTSACVDPVTGGYWTQTAEGGIAGHRGAWAQGGYKDHADELGGNVRYFTGLVPNGLGGYLQLANDGSVYDSKDWGK